MLKVLRDLFRDSNNHFCERVSNELPENDKKELSDEKRYEKAIEELGLNKEDVEAFNNKRVKGEEKEIENHNDEIDYSYFKIPVSNKSCYDYMEVNFDEFGSKNNKSRYGYKL